MKLFYSQTSPYARKVRLAAVALGLADAIEVVVRAASPVAEDADLVAANPLGKIPALVLDDRRVLFDSRVIVEYLDHVAGGGLLPGPSDPERWETLRLQALADGVLDAALLMRYEVALRPEALLWRDWLDGQRRKVERALAALEADVERVAGGAPLNAIAVTCALGYLDYRFADLPWRGDHPGLARFFAEYSARPEMVLTDPAA